MISKSSVAGTSEEVVSVAPKVSVNPNSAGKVKSVNEPAPVKRPVFIHSLKTLKAELRTNINEKWEACWPINMLRPLVLLDLISYLLFIKKLEEKQLSAGENTENRPGNSVTKEKNELSWSTLKEMDAQSLHELFTKERGLPDLIRNYSHSNLPYSLFLKEPLLLVPTGKLLINMLAIIKIMDAEDRDTQGAIFEYLLNKAEIAGHNGQVYAPDYVTKLMVSLMQPAPEDIIGDPCAGNGSFFVNSAMYIANKNADAAPTLKNDAVPNIYKGIESDLIQLRIGAMNMILHGIENPKIEVLNVFSKTNINLREQPTLILSNLFFEATEDKIANNPQTETRKPEIRFLDLILKGLKSGGRAAVILREIILYENKPEIKTIRQHIIDDHKLEAVISLHGKAGSIFSNASILIFSKPESAATDKVWFYKMEIKEGIHRKNTDSINTAKNDVLDYTEEYNGVLDILARWKNEPEENGRKRLDKSFYVPVDEIKANNYNLSFNEYRRSVNEPELYANRKPISPVKNDIPVGTSQKVMDNMPGKAEAITPVKIAPPVVPDITPEKVAAVALPVVPAINPEKVDSVEAPADVIAASVNLVTPQVDTVTPQVDTVTPQLDAVTPQLDAVTPQLDAVTPQLDTVAPQEDAVVPEPTDDTKPGSVLNNGSPDGVDTDAGKLGEVTLPIGTDSSVVEIADETPQISVDATPFTMVNNTPEPGKVADDNDKPGKVADKPLSKVIDITPRKTVASTAHQQENPYVEKIKFPAKATTPFIKRRSTIFASLLIVCVIVGAIYFMRSKSMTPSTVSTTVNNTSAGASSPAQPTGKDATTKAAGTSMLSSAQIKAILKDTTGILHFPGQVASVPVKTDKEKKLVKPGNANILVGKNLEPAAAPASALRVKYSVTDTTFFHDEPDASTRRKSYLDPLNKNILTPMDDRNGYIYIVYANRFGRVSKGWINKKDLKLIR